MTDNNPSNPIQPDDSRLTDFVLGELSPELTHQIEVSIKESPELAAAVQEIRQTVDLLGLAYRSEEPVGLLASQKDELNQVATSSELAQPASVVKSTESSGASRSWWGMTITAALMALLVGGALYLANPDNLLQQVAMSEKSQRAPAKVVAGRETGVQADSADMMPKSEAFSIADNAIMLEEELPDDNMDFSVEAEPSAPSGYGGMGGGAGAGRSQGARYAEGGDSEFWDPLGEATATPFSSKTPDFDSLELAQSQRRIARVRGGVGGGGGGFGGGQQPQAGASVGAGLGKSDAGGMSDSEPLSFKAAEAQSGGQAGGEVDPTGGRARGRSPEFLAGGEVPIPMPAEASPSETRNQALPQKAASVQNSNAPERTARGSGFGQPDSSGQSDGLARNDVERQGRARSVPKPAMLNDMRKLGIQVEVHEESDELVLKSEEAEKLVEMLTKEIDPDGKKTLNIEEILELDDKGVVQSKDQNESEAESSKPRVASTLRKTLEQAKGKSISTGKLLGELKRLAEKKNKEIRAKRSWKRVEAIPNTTRLMVGEKDELELTGLQANVRVDGFRAQVLLDYFYYNDRTEQLEGNFKLRLPDDASLYYFAFGESAYELGTKGKLAVEEFGGEDTQFVSFQAPDIRDARKDVWANVKEARMVPKEKAAHAFRETVRRKIDPALVEWSGAGIFNARVFPLAPKKLHRIVVGYEVDLQRIGKDWIYDLKIPSESGQTNVNLHVEPVEGATYEISPTADPYEIAVGDKTMKRFRYTGKQPEGIQLKVKGLPEVALKSGDDQAFWGTKLMPQLPRNRTQGNDRALFLLDTSLSSNPDKFTVWLKMMAAVLNNNRDSIKKFNVIFFNVDAHSWQEKWVENNEVEVDKLLMRCDQLVLEGATDLYGAIKHAATSQWLFPEQELAAGPDVFLMSDGAANWGETNLRLIERQLNEGGFGNLFAYQTGMTGTAIANLRFLAGESGGAVFSVGTEDEIKVASRAHRNVPWKLVSMESKGATDLMTAGRVKWVYPGQAITLVGRGSLDEPIKLHLEQGDQKEVVTFQPTVLESDMASRLYGQVAVGQLESLGSSVFDVAAAYARHFRVTGDTCSLLMLESEADYERFDIKPEEDLFVIKTKAANELVSETLKRSAEELADPKAQLVAWMKRLETMPGMQFKMPTALGLAMDDIKIEAVTDSLDCELTELESVSESYLKQMESERLDYAQIQAEANRRVGTSIDEAVKVYSSLIERNPGDLEITRDVAFTAMELGRPAQAFHLLRRVSYARPFEGSIYPALGQCLTQLGKADLAIVYYEIALGGSFQRRGDNFKQIVALEYMHLLRKVKRGELNSSVEEFVDARLDTLTKEYGFKDTKFVVTMLWNTDQTDVDLHVVEPNGEVCSYENTRTRSGGNMTSDITTGFGPEMYYHHKAPQGKYDVQVKFFSNGQSRTELRNKVHLLIYRDVGSDKERVTRRTVELKTVGNKQSVAVIGVDP